MLGTIVAMAGHPASTPIGQGRDTEPVPLVGSCLPRKHISLDASMDGNQSVQRRRQTDTRGCQTPDSLMPVRADTCV